MAASMTVTATQGGTPVNGMLLRVFVLTGAADASLQTGATATKGAGTGNVTASITTTVTGSVVYGAIVKANTALTAVAGCVLDDDVYDSSITVSFGTVETTPATGTPGAATVGATCSLSGTGAGAFAEILPNGTIAEDASAPAVVNTTAATTATTASFTPPDGALLLALVPTKGTGLMTVSGGGYTWTQLAHVSLSAEVAVWIAQVPAVAGPGSAIVTATAGGSTANGMWLRVLVLTGAAPTDLQTGATATANGAQEAAITTTAQGSVVYGAAAEIGSATTLAAASGTTALGSLTDVTNSGAYGGFQSASATTTPGAATVGYTNGTAGGAALAEILPTAAGVITQDASTSGQIIITNATTLSTGVIYPPNGSVFLALVGSNGGAGVTTMFVEGGGLAWTEIAVANASGAGYAGVWVAQFPVPGSGGDPVITATAGGVTANGILLRTFVLTGAKAAALQTGGTSNNQFSAATSFTQAVTTTVTGSRVYGASAPHANNSATAVAATTVVDNVADATNLERFVTFKATSLTGTPGATTLGFTVASSSGPFAQAEILPNGTLTENASAPAQVNTLAATSVACVNFTPPYGSLIVCLVASDGGAGVASMALTSVPALTWTELARNNPSSGHYAGVWVADAPPGNPVIVVARPGKTWRERHKHWQQVLAPAPPPPAAGVTIRGTPVFDGTGATTTASSRAPAVTAGTVPGELLVAAICWSGSTVTLTNPSGWTLLHNTQQTNDNLASYYRYADGSGTDSPTFTLSAPCTCIAFNATFSGAAASGAPVSANVLGGAASTTAAYPAVTPANASDLLVYLPGIRPTTASTQPALSTLPAGGTGGAVTQVAFNSTNVSGSAESGLGILTQQLTAATAVSQETSTISTSSSCDCEALCIAAAAGGGAANVTGTAAPAAVAAPAGVAASSANITGLAAPVTVASPAAVPSSGSAVTGPAAPVTAAAPAGVPHSDGAVTGAAGPVTVAAAPGAAAGTSPNANVTGAAAPVTVASPAGVFAGSANVAGLAAPVTVASAAGVNASGAAPAGAAAPVTAAALAGVPSAAAKVTGLAAPVTVGAPAGVPAGSAATTGLAAPVTAAALAGVPSAAANIAGAAAPVTVAAPAGVPFGGVSGAANVTGAAAAATLTGAAGALATGASVTGLAAPVTAASPAAVASSGSALTGTAAPVTGAGGQGTAAAPGAVTGTAAHVTAASPAGTTAAAAGITAAAAPVLAAAPAGALAAAANATGLGALVTVLGAPGAPAGALPFTIGALSGSLAPTAVLAATAAASSVLGAAVAPSSTITAGTQRTGGPG